MGLSYKEVMTFAEEFAASEAKHLGSCMEAAHKAWKRWFKEQKLPKDWKVTLRSRWFSAESLWRCSVKSDILRDKEQRRKDGKHI